MDIQATCGCGAKITLAPGRPSDLGNGHGYALNNDATVNAEREAVAEAFAKWVEHHAACQRPPVVIPGPQWHDIPPPSFGPTTTMGAGGIPIPD